MCVCVFVPSDTFSKPVFETVLIVCQYTVRRRQYDRLS